MKLNKYLLGGLAGLVIAPTAYADFTIYMTGSTAFRAAAYAGVKSLYDNTVHVNAASLNANGDLVCVANAQAPLAPTSDSTFNGANFMAFSGTMPAFGSQVVTIYCNWSGSVEGIRDVVQANALPFLSTADSQTTAFTNAAPGSAVADFAFSDVFQNTTIYKTPTMATKQLGVIPFTFVKNQGASGNLTNITHQQAQTLLANGVVPLAFITGDLSSGGDTNRVACLIGRYNGSGTRAVVFADTGYGALKSSVNYMYSLTAGPGSTPAFTQVSPDPNIGYTSGSSIKSDMSKSISQALGTDGSTYVTGYAVGYLGVKDAYGVTGNSAGLLNLTYNGVAFSTNAVQNGQYTMWSYEHLYNKTPLSTDKTTFKNNLATAIPLNLGTGTTIFGIPTSAMTVQRSVDGGPIGTTY